MNQKRVRCFSIKKINDQSTTHTNARNVMKEVENGTIKSAQHRIEFRCFVMKVEKEKERTIERKSEREREKECVCIYVFTNDPSRLCQPDKRVIFL